MEPVKVKVYGLFWQTKRRYVVQSIIGIVYGVGLLIIWWLKWKPFRETLLRPDAPMPGWMIVTIIVLNELPWILLITAVIKAFEMWIILRKFKAKEAEQLANPPKPST